MRAGLAVLLLVGCLVLAPSARADDPPHVDLLAALGLEPEREVAGLSVNQELACRVVDAERARMFELGQRVFVTGQGNGSFNVRPDAPGLSACVVHFTVHVADLLPPARALRALGLEGADTPLPEGEHRNATVTRPELLRAHGLTPDGVGALASVRNRGGARWDVNTYGKEPSFATIDVAPWFHYRSPFTETLERATIELRPATLPVGGRLLAQAADPEKLAALGIASMPAGHLVLVQRTGEATLNLTTVSPGFRRQVEVEGLDLAAYGLDGVQLHDLPVGTRIEGYVVSGWRAGKVGLRRARSKDPVAIEHVEGEGYVLQNLAPKRHATVRLAE